MLKESLHGAVGVAVSVAVWQSEELSVAPEKGKVAAPRVDAYRGEGNALVGHAAQGVEDFAVESGQIPEEVSQHGQLGIGEARELTALDALSVPGGEHGPSACGAKIYCKKVLHRISFLLWKMVFSLQIYDFLVKGRSDKAKKFPQPGRKCRPPCLRHSGACRPFCRICNPAEKNISICNAIRKVWRDYKSL